MLKIDINTRNNHFLNLDKTLLVNSHFEAQDYTYKNKHRDRNLNIQSVSVLS